MNDQGKETPRELVYVRPVGSDYCSSDDEISLIDLWLVMIQRKWIILSVALLGLALGAGYMWMTPLKFQYTTGITLAELYNGGGIVGVLSQGKTLLSSQDGEGIVGVLSQGTTFLSSQDSIVSMLRTQIIPDHRRDLSREGGPVPSVAVIVPKEDYSCLKLSTIAEPENSQQVTKLHQVVVDDLVARDTAELKQRIDIISKPFVAKAAMLQQQLVTQKEQLQRLSSRIDEGDEVHRLIYAQQMGDIRAQILEIDLQLVDATSEAALIRNVSHPARIQYLAVKTGGAVGPSRAVVMAIALVLGIMGGIFLAFFWEFVGRARAELKKRGA